MCETNAGNLLRLSDTTLVNLLEIKVKIIYHDKNIVPCVIRTCKGVWGKN